MAGAGNVVVPNDEERPALQAIAGEVEPMSEEELAILTETINLLNSMVKSGENHSSRSLALVVKAMSILREQRQAQEE